MTSDQLGGLSGIWFSQQNQKFHLVSDSSRLAYMVDMTWTPEDNGSFPKIGTEIEIKNPDSKGAFERFDLEDIVQLQNGHFLVASEVDDGDRNEKESKGKSFFDRMFQTRKSEKLSVTPLMELNAKGELLREIPLPDDLIPKVEEFVKQYECYKPPVYSQSSNTKYSPPPTTKPGSSNIGGSTTTNPRSAGNELLDFYDTAKREASAKAMVAELPPSTTTTTLPPKPQICTSKELRQTRGFSENKGIEALSYLESTKEIFFGTEGPIVQDRSDSQKFVRIYRQLLGQENAAQKYVKYPLTRQFDNSMSALLPLDQNRLLVLERGFDDQKMETHVKIFLVNWASLDKEGYLNKTLIVEMNSLRDQLPAGFRKFDNLEGMTISGETVTDLTLVLISDNNFRDSQVSQIVALKIPKRLLGE
jgi:hypothetical protein